MLDTVDTTHHDIPKVEQLFSIVTNVLTAIHSDGDNHSGAVILLCTNAGDELLSKRKGTGSEQKFIDCEHYATKKIKTLLDHPEHRLSFESCDMANGPYPGGARFPPLLLLAISGFTWQEDEVSVLWIGFKMGWIELKEIPPLLKMSQGKLDLFTKLFCLFERAEQEALAA
jgi:hypothetical protein